MKPTDEFIENYYYPCLKSSDRCKEAFRMASRRWKQEKGMDSPLSGYESLRKTIYRKRKNKKK